MRDACCKPCGQALVPEVEGRWSGSLAGSCCEIKAGGPGRGPGSQHSTRRWEQETRAFVMFRLAAAAPPAVALLPNGTHSREVERSCSGQDDGRKPPPKAGLGVLAHWVRANVDLQQRTRQLLAAQLASLSCRRGMEHTVREGLRKVAQQQGFRAGSGRAGGKCWRRALAAGPARAAVRRPADVKQ